MLGYVSPSKTRTAKKDAMNFELRIQLKYVVNNIYGAISRLLVVCEMKERDKSAKQILQKLETTANKTSKNKN